MSHPAPFDPPFDPVSAELPQLRPTRVEVDCDRLGANLAAIRSRVGGAAVMPILKANAYGHGLVPVALYLESLGADAFGVAVVEEGVLLRQAGVRAPILVLGGVSRSQIATYLEHDLIFTASSREKLRQIEAVATDLGAVAKVHLEVDTGMERIGVHWYSAEGFFATALACRHIAIEGLYSHLATADEADLEPTRIQIERFELVRRTYQQMAGALPRWSHLANSGAILQHPQATFDLVRPGLALYGVYPCPHVAPTLALLPALRWTTQVAYFKVVRAGDPVSYGGTWSSPVDTRVITLPVGYGDGYPRRLSNRAEVLVRGQRYPLAGRVCMDMAMVAIGAGSAWNGDEVVLIGEDGADAIRVEDLAEWAETIPWEILTGISTRVPRRYRVAGELVDRRSLRTPSDSK